ncbi:MAG: ATP-dependent sacrificial sulfur transferase LarE [Candidatus Krumholzibacteriota bacterium]|nr:ATP-dependent sacrificial sulfur transferase LarE [Candidatus Krumholzibacteriota bacterium]
MTPPAGSSLPLPDDAARAKEAALRRLLAAGGRSLLAFSGGVDSAYLAAVARETLGEDLQAVLADGPTLPDWEREAAVDLASELGLPLRILHTAELADPAFRANGPERCYHCRRHLFGALRDLAAAEGWETLLHGGNADDDAGDRPGLRAAAEHGIRAPLREAGLGKAEIRALARTRGLSAWDRPSRPCLATRIPFGVPLDEAVLGRVAAAERALHRRGFRDYRVRHHGDLARIELGGGEWERLADPELREDLRRELTAQDYRLVTLDLAPLASGSLSRLGILTGDLGLRSVANDAEPPEAEP